jgi:hypothetical protein
MSWGLACCRPPARPLGVYAPKISIDAMLPPA